MRAFFISTRRNYALYDEFEQCKYRSSHTPDLTIAQHLHKKCDSVSPRLTVKGVQYSKHRSQGADMPMPKL